MTTVPAHNFSAPARAAVMAAARFIPGVCGVLTSSSSACTTRTPCRRHFDAVGAVMSPLGMSLSAFALRLVYVKAVEAGNARIERTGLRPQAIDNPLAAAAR